jgi:uncharacterized membrane protein YjjB (DUF3815 family)
MDWFVQAICSFLATLTLAAFFQAPRHALVSCGLAGLLGWAVYYALIVQGIDKVPASFCGSFVVAIAAHLMARIHKMPMIVFSVAGIIPFVPGGMAYEAMRSIVAYEYIESWQYATRTGMITGAIVMGFVTAEVLVNAVQRIKTAFT